jgi:hypothetical protein
MRWHLRSLIIVITSLPACHIRHTQAEFPPSAAAEPYAQLLARPE